MPSTVKQYRRQVEVVQGFQYDGTNMQDVIDFCQGSEGTAAIEDGKLILTHPGGAKQEIRPNDWVLADAWGKNFVMADTDFHIVYAPGPNT
jgi:hypothetical protein